jgi:hypothetical protein
MADMLFYFTANCEKMPVIVRPFDEIEIIFHLSVAIAVEEILGFHVITDFVSAQSLGYGYQDIYH